MPRILTLILSFFILESLLLGTLAWHYPSATLIYLFTSGIVGWWLLTRSQRLVFMSIGARLQQGEPALSVISPLRYPLAGLLILLPGILSDVMALIILLLPRPRQSPTQANTKGPTKDGAIEGEFHRVD